MIIIKDPLHSHLRDWGVTLLCGAVTTFSGSSKDPSRPQKGRERLLFIGYWL